MSTQKPTKKVARADNPKLVARPDYTQGNAPIAPRNAPQTRQMVTEAKQPKDPREYRADVLE